MKDLRDILEGIFDVDDNLDNMDNVIQIGNYYKLHWYDVKSDSDFSYFFKKAEIKKLAKQQGYFDNSKFGLATRSVPGSGMTKVRNAYMLPLCNAIMRLQYNTDFQVVKDNICNFVKKYETGLVHVHIEENSKIKDDTLTIVLRRVTDDGTKKITMRFVKEK